MWSVQGSPGQGRFGFGHVGGGFNIGKIVLAFWLQREFYTRKLVTVQLVLALKLHN